MLDSAFFAQVKQQDSETAARLLDDANPSSGPGGPGGPSGDNRHRGFGTPLPPDQIPDEFSRIALGTGIGAFMGVQYQVAGARMIRAFRLGAKLGSGLENPPLPPAFNPVDESALLLKIRDSALKGAATAAGALVVDAAIDKVFFPNQGMSASTLLSDLVVTPALALFPGPMLVKGAIAVGAHVGARLYERYSAENSD